MASIGYLLGGAMAGAGQGLQTIGATAEKEQSIEKEHNWQQAHDETMERLRAAEQEKLQASGQTFEKGQTETKLKAAAAAAGATREFEQGENVKQRAAAQKRTETSANARVDAAAVQASSRSSVASGKGIKALVPRNVNIMPTGPDGKPIPGALPEQHILTYDPNTGIHWVQTGNRFYRADSSGKAVVDPKSTNNKGASPGENQALLANPYARVPAGYANAGMTYAEAYEQEHGFLPGEFLGTVNKLAQRQSSSQSSSVRLPSGRIYNPPAGGGQGGEGPDAGGPAPPEPGDEAEGEGPAFQSNAMSNYGANAQ
jgi:hypothetical protein